MDTVHLCFIIQIKTLVKYKKSFLHPFRDASYNILAKLDLAKLHYTNFVYFMYLINIIVIKWTTKNL